MGGTCKFKMTVPRRDRWEQNNKEHESPKQVNDLTKYVCLTSCDDDILSSLGGEGGISFEGDFSHRDLKDMWKAGCRGAGQVAGIASRPFG